MTGFLPSDPNSGPNLGLNRSLAALRDSIGGGGITDRVALAPDLAPDLTLHADPALQVSGQFRSPAGRLLELDLTTGDEAKDHIGWIGLHVALSTPDLSGAAYVGLICRSAAPEIQVIRPCLRSGSDADHDKGFVDCFFDKHILSRTDPTDHVDALHIATHRALPETATWRELVLFLPTRSFRWDLHDLRLFIV